MVAVFLLGAIPGLFSTTNPVFERNPPFFASGPLLFAGAVAGQIRRLFQVSLSSPACPSFFSQRLVVILFFQESTICPADLPCFQQIWKFRRDNGQLSCRAPAPLSESFFFPLTFPLVPRLELPFFRTSMFSNLSPPVDISSPFYWRVVLFLPHFLVGSHIGLLPELCEAFLLLGAVMAELL